jgi:multidrug efflux pump
VLLALPFGTFGALAAVYISHHTNDVYFQIGLVTLLGLASKNAILIVEFASHMYHQGMSASAAALEAARLRFRPILMTSMAFILGVLPLALATGAGAGARSSVGTGVMGGMLAATFLAVFFVPLFFRFFEEFKLTEKRTRDEMFAEVRDRHSHKGPPKTPGHPPIQSHGDDHA